MSGSWHSPLVDEGRVAALAKILGLQPLTARLLVRRGLTEEAEANRFLQPRLGALRGPGGFADLPRAIERIAAAIAEKQLVGVFGDYDVDGVTSAAVLTTGLRALGASVLPRCASRHAGYGFGMGEAQTFAAAGCKLVITADCGTSDHVSIAFLRDNAVDVVVIDHHQVPEGNSPALALINPHRSDDLFEFKGLASCGLAFYLMSALRSHLRARGHALATVWDPRELLDLVAMGTIADVMPLQHENRVLVSAGLRALSAKPRPGVAALFKVAGIEPEKVITATDVGFKLSPRLNAAGRLGDAQLALDLLLATDVAEADRLAQLLDEQNRKRREIQETVMAAALLQVEALIEQAGGNLPFALVVGDEGWHHGVVGIVAAKLVDRYARPAIVVGFNEGKGRGSARTILGFNLYEALTHAGEHLEVYGGHAAAAGMTVTHERFAAFRAAFLHHTEKWFSQRPVAMAVEVDAIVSFEDLNMTCADELERLGPFGAANCEPLLAFPGVTVVSSRVVGTNHLLLTLSQGGAAFDAIGFGMAAAAPETGQPIDVVGCFEVNAFRGARKLRLRIKHLFKPIRSAT